MFRRSEFPITAHFELLPRSPALAESGAVSEHREFISSVFCFLGFGGSERVLKTGPGGVLVCSVG